MCGEVSNYLVVIYRVTFDFVQRSEHLDHFVKFLVFFYRCHCWRVVLLKTHDHVGYEGTLTRQKGWACFKSHCVPHLAIFELILLRFGQICFSRIKLISTPWWSTFRLRELLRQKPEFCADAEVRHGQKDDLFEHRVSGKFMRIVNVKVEFVQTHWKQMHNISNVEVENPVILIFDSQDRFHVILQLYVAFFAAWKRASRIFANSTRVVIRRLVVAIAALFKYLLGSWLVWNWRNALISIYSFRKSLYWARDTTQIIILQISVSICLFLFVQRYSAIWAIFGDFWKVLQINVRLYRKLLNDRFQNVDTISHRRFFLIAALSVHASRQIVI